MTNTEQMAKIIEDALAKQKENFKFELEMTMTRMKEEQDQQIRALSNQLDESCRHNIANQVGSDSDVDKHLNGDNPPADQNAGGVPTEDNDVGGGPTEDDNTGGGCIISLRNHPKHDTDEDEKMKDLERKINALMYARKVKKTGIPRPYPRE